MDKQIALGQLRGSFSASCRGCHIWVSMYPSPQPRAPTSEDRGDTGHLPATIEAAFQLVRTLAVHLALVPAEAELGEGDVHLRAGALLLWVEKGVRGGEQSRSRRLHMSPQHVCPPGFTNKSAACLSESLGAWKFVCNFPLSCSLLPGVLRSLDSSLSPSFAFS